jgi:hypothetical protein
MTKIQNNKEALCFTFFKIGRIPYRFDHLVFGFQICFEFRYSDFGFNVKMFINIPFPR